MHIRHKQQHRQFSQWREEFSRNYRKHHTIAPRESLIKLVWRNLDSTGVNKPRPGETVAEHHNSHIIDIISDNIVTVRSGGAEFQCLVKRGPDKLLHLVHSLS